MTDAFLFFFNETPGDFMKFKHLNFSTLDHNKKNKQNLKKPIFGDIRCNNRNNLTT